VKEVSRTDFGATSTMGVVGNKASKTSIETSGKSLSRVEGDGAARSSAGSSPSPLMDAMPDMSLLKQSKEEDEGDSGTSKGADMIESSSLTPLIWVDAEDAGDTALEAPTCEPGELAETSRALPIASSNAEMD